MHHASKLNGAMQRRAPGADRQYSSAPAPPAGRPHPVVKHGKSSPVYNLILYGTVHGYTVRAAYEFIFQFHIRVEFRSDRMFLPANSQ
eukprot:COSAG02_NODE_1816_length_10778_cov_4.675812_5_plen_88_part_00